MLTRRPEAMFCRVRSSSRLGSGRLAAHACSPRAVRADRDGYESGRDGGGRTAGGSAGGVVELPGVAGGAERAAFGEGPLAEFGFVGFADDDGACGAEQPDGVGVAGGGWEGAGA